jgi:hypothetical protein
MDALAMLKGCMDTLSGTVTRLAEEASLERQAATATTVETGWEPVEQGWVHRILYCEVKREVLPVDDTNTVRVVWSWRGTRFPTCLQAIEAVHKSYRLRAYWIEEGK